jgi:hypothetical protein
MEEPWSSVISSEPDGNVVTGGSNVDDVPARLRASGCKHEDVPSAGDNVQGFCSCIPSYWHYEPHRMRAGKDN